MELRGLALIPLVVLHAAAPAVGQSSASYVVEEAAINAGGRPRQGVVASSASFRVSLDAIGDALSAGATAGPGASVDPGFVAAYPPPGEVLDLHFTSGTALAWSGEGSGGGYSVYRDPLMALPGGTGQCVAPAVAGTSWNDTAVPPAGGGFLYLVTARNRLREEGTKGFGTGGERANPTPCP